MLREQRRACIKDQQQERHTQRGLRPDETAEAYGLGLAIVRDIFNQYKVKIQLGGSEKLGGLKISLSVPVGGAGE